MSAKNKRGDNDLVGARRSRRGRQRRSSTKRERAPRKPRATNTRRSTSETSKRVTLSPEAKGFIQAVTNPFSDAAIGAIVPDQWCPPTIAGNDRLTLTLDPAEWKKRLPTLTITGWVVYFVPRSLALGWRALDTDDKLLHAVVPMNMDFTTPDSDPRAALYSLYVGAIGTIEDGPVKIWAHDNQYSEKFQPGINSIPFSRHDIIESTTNGARIVGAGIKAFPNSAPLTTGGTVYGGWMPLTDLQHHVPNSLLDPLQLSTPDIEDLGDFLPLTRNSAATCSERGFTSSRGAPPSKVRRDCLESKHDYGESIEVQRGRIRPHAKLNRPAVTLFNTDPADIQDNLRYRHSYPGTKGVTVRYSPLQSPTQEEFRIPFDGALVAGLTVAGGFTNRDVGGGVNDLISGSDMVPGFVWKYNVVNDATESYSIRVEARVHLQCVPDATNPFLTASAMPDASFPTIAMSLENKDIYPVVSMGNSFSSLIRNFNEGVDAIVRAASKIPILGRLMA